MIGHRHSPSFLHHSLNHSPSLPLKKSQGYLRVSSLRFVRNHQGQATMEQGVPVDCSSSTSGSPRNFQGLWFSIKTTVMDPQLVVFRTMLKHPFLVIHEHATMVDLFAFTWIRMLRQAHFAALPSLSTTCGVIGLRSFYFIHMSWSPWHCLLLLLHFLLLEKSSGNQGLSPWNMFNDS